MRDNRSFVLTGNSFLLVIPALILAASFATMIETGDRATATAIKSDLVFYAYKDIKSSFERTSCALIDAYGNDTAKIREGLNTTWANFIEQNYTQEIGVNVSVPEENINVTDNIAKHRIEIGNLDTSESIPITVMDLESNIVYNSTIGPVISSYNNPPLTPDLISPIDGWTTDDTTPLLNWSDSIDPDGDSITYEVQVDKAGEDWSELDANTSGINISSWEVSPELKDSTTYQWRVRPTDGIENETWVDPCVLPKKSSYSDTWVFTVNTSAIPLEVEFVAGYPKSGVDDRVHVKANVTTDSSPITDANVIVELVLGGVVQETGTMEHIGGGIYGNATTLDDWISTITFSKGDVVTVTVYAMKDGYVSDLVTGTT